MDPNPTDYSKLPPNAVKSKIAKAPTLADAEEIFALCRPTPSAVAAITARRTGIPVMGTPLQAPPAALDPSTPERLVVVGADKQAEVVQGLVKQHGGIPKLRDFNERQESGTAVPAWLKKILDAKGLDTCAIETANLASDPRTSGHEAYVVPITKATLPEVPEEYLNERGVLVWKDQTRCVGYKENFDRARERDRRVHADKAITTKAKQRTVKAKTDRGEVDAPITMGILPGKSVNPHGAGVGGVNSSLDRALAAASE